VDVQGEIARGAKVEAEAEAEAEVESLTYVLLITHLRTGITFHRSNAKE
jgi:hypothetical protein